jgi:hypothetical protein
MHYRPDDIDLEIFKIKVIPLETDQLAATLPGTGQPIARFSDRVLQSGIELPHRAIMANIGNSVDLLIHIARIRGRRSIAEILTVQGFDSADEQCRLSPAES